MDSKKQRKHYNPQFKSKVVQEYLQGDKSRGELASQYEIHPNLILKWKSAALSALPDALDERAQKPLTPSKLSTNGKKKNYTLKSAG